MFSSVISSASTIAFKSKQWDSMASLDNSKSQTLPTLTEEAKGRIDQLGKALLMEVCRVPAVDNNFQIQNDNTLRGASLHIRGK